VPSDEAEFKEVWDSRWADLQRTYPGLEFEKKVLLALVYLPEAVSVNINTLAQMLLNEGDLLEFEHLLMVIDALNAREMICIELRDDIPFVCLTTEIRTKLAASLPPETQKYFRDVHSRVVAETQDDATKLSPRDESPGIEPPSRRAKKKSVESGSITSSVLLKTDERDPDAPSSDPQLSQTTPWTFIRIACVLVWAYGTALVGHGRLTLEDALVAAAGTCTVTLGIPAAVAAAFSRGSLNRFSKSLFWIGMVLSSAAFFEEMTR
jgi:hypothetical protein